MPTPCVTDGRASLPDAVRRGPGRWLAAAAAAWVVLILAAPVALAHGTVWLPAIVYEAGSLICHQRPDRSFHLAGAQLPVCARCFGLYAAGAAGALGAALADRPFHVVRRLPSIVLVLGVSGAPTAITWAAEWVGLAHVSGVMRAIAALPLGIAIGWVLVAQCDAITRRAG